MLPKKVTETDETFIPWSDGADVYDTLSRNGRLITRHYPTLGMTTVRANRVPGVFVLPEPDIPLHIALPTWECAYCGSSYAEGFVQKCQSCGAPRGKR